MRRPGSRRGASDDPDDDAEDADVEEARTPRPRRGTRSPPRQWDADREDDDEEAPPTRRRWRAAGKPEKEPVYFRARDSIFFEPLIALAIIALLLVSLYAYTQNWPPVYVVESSSMQHGTVDQVGLINTGDLVLAQKVSLSQITPYVVGLANGYQTYGEYGDVLLYEQDGRAGVTPIIHRALVYLEANPDGSFNAPELKGLPCGSASNWFFSANSTLLGNGCSTTDLTGVLTLRGVGWQSVTVNIDLSSVGRSSGFVTMGDNNFVGNLGTPDEPVLTSLVEPGWIVGVARGMVPWFGALKLLIEGNAAEVPSQSWEWLALSVLALVGAAAGVHYLLRAEGIEDPRRKRQEEETAGDDEEEEDDEEGSSRPGRSWRHPLRGWRDEEDAADDEKPSKSSDYSRKSRGRGGRPHPDVGRHPAPDTEDEDL